jgi:hypothetical protein
MGSLLLLKINKTKNGNDVLIFSFIIKITSNYRFTIYIVVIRD